MNTDDADAMVRQAALNAAVFLEAAVQAVDQRFGTGGATTYPQLVVAFMHAAALGHGAARMARAVEAAHGPLS